MYRICRCNLEFALLILFSLLAKLVQAQSSDLQLKSKHELNISISFGAALPLGKFSKFADRDQYSYPANIIGGAMTGINSKIEGQYYFSEKVGLVISAGKIRSKIGVITYDQLYPLPNNGLGGGSSSESFEYASTNWNAINLLAGLTTRIKYGVADIDLKILAGYQQLKSPEVQINEEIKWWMSVVGSGINTRSSFQPGLIAENLALNLGADLKVHVYKKVELMLSFDYILSSPQYKSQIVYIYDKSGPTPSHSETYVASEFQESVSFLCVNFGVGYKLY
jgi:hypothetical protein